MRRGSITEKKLQRESKRKEKHERKLQEAKQRKQARAQVHLVNGLLPQPNWKPYPSMM